MFLIRHRPAVIWYQFSWLLGLVLALYARLRGEDRSLLVADIHTKALRRVGPHGLRPLILWLKGWSLRVARVTLVTNNENAAYAARQFGISPLVLPDPLPRPPPDIFTRKLEEAADVVFVCSFASDEPLELLLNVARRLSSNLTIAITGCSNRLAPDMVEQLSGVAWLTGFLTDADYWSLLYRASTVVVLSTQPACLPSGAYEAIAIGRRPVLAHDAEVIATFGDCATYTKLDPDALEEALLRSVADGASTQDSALPRIYEQKWQEVWNEVRTKLEAQEVIEGR